MATRSVLDLPDFRRLFVTRVAATTALQVQAVIVGWQVWTLTHDALLLGLLGLVEAVPAIGTSFVSGHVVDRNRPAAVYGFSVAFSAVNALVMLTAVLPFVPLADATRLALLYVGIFLSGSARSFASPAVFTLIPQIVARGEIASAAAWNSTSYQLAAIAGPALGGLVYALLGPVAAFSLPPLLMGAAAFGVVTMSAAARTAHVEGEREPFLVSLRGAIGFALGHRVLLSAMTLDMLSVLFGGAIAVLPVFADTVFHTGSLGLGLLRAAPSVGSALVAARFATKTPDVISGRTLLLCVAGFGVSTIAFAVSTNVVLAWLFLAASGAFDGVSMVIRSTLLQLLTPDRMRGRVSALSSVFITSSNEIGAFESGLAASLVGIVPSVILGGTATLVVVALTALLAPELRDTALPSDAPPPA